MYTLFLPGSFRRCSDYQWLSECLAYNTDFYAYDYPVSSTVAKLNSQHYNSDSLLKVRRELIYGSQSISDPRLSIPYEDSVVGSFLAQVRSRHGQAMSDQDILYNTLIVGHSQGAGHAAVISIDYNLSGVLLISGPADSYQQVPSSWTGIRARTSRDRVKMFIHAEDRHAKMCLSHSTMLGLKDISVLTESSELADIVSSQVVIDTRTLPPVKSHDCLTFNSERHDDFNKQYLSAVIDIFKLVSSVGDFSISTLSH